MLLTLLVSQIALEIQNQEILEEHKEEDDDENETTEESSEERILQQRDFENKHSLLVSLIQMLIKKDFFKRTLIHCLDSIPLTTQKKIVSDWYCFHCSLHLLALHLALLLPFPVFETYLYTLIIIFQLPYHM